ncbi:MAG TPA: hypothetical protein VHU92_13430 [Streptosporangiaceae bacterium]|jgi:hypothetical protein|nr:hypothetical protein [Streptosporangiaceae bacterium]
MNADTAGTRSSHLDLEDLIARANGQEVDERAREHLASCEQCQLEMSRWALVADGVRGLAGEVPEAVPPGRPLAARRRAWLAGAAAAVVLLGGVGYAVSRLTGHPPEAVLTSVGGCSGVRLASGTLERVTGSSLVIKTAGGQSVTVSTTRSTKETVAGPLLSDITDGAPVIVLGPRSAGTVRAVSATVGLPPVGVGQGSLKQTPPPGWVSVRGTVAAAGSAGFSVVTSDGSRVRVVTSSSTFVVVPRASLSQLRTGVTVVAVGYAGGRRTLSALGVVQEPPGSIQVHFSIAARGCSQASLASAIATALVSRG